MKTNGWMPTLVLTGERRERRYGILIGRQPVWLPRALFRALLALVRARMSSRDAFVRLRPMVVCRLRKEIAKAIGPEKANDFIATGDTCHYSLGVESACITVRPRFRVCPLPGPFLRRTKAAILRSTNRPRKHQRT